MALTGQCVPSSSLLHQLRKAQTQHAAFRSGCQPVARQGMSRTAQGQAGSQQGVEGSRRGFLLALTAVITANPSAPAHADLRTFLQSRQEIYAIAPIGVGQRKLKEAADLLASAQNETTRRAALKMLRAASFNCYQYESRGAATLDAKASLVQQSIQESFPQLVDPCTYRLIAKNVTKLVPNREAGLREEVDASLQSLLRSFNLLDDALEAAMDGDDKAARKVDERMQATRDSMDRFDSSIKHCLHMA